MAFGFVTFHRKMLFVLLHSKFRPVDIIILMITVVIYIVIIVIMLLFLISLLLLLCYCYYYYYVIVTIMINSNLSFVLFRVMSFDQHIQNSHFTLDANFMATLPPSPPPANHRHGRRLRRARGGPPSDGQREALPAPDGPPRTPHAQQTAPADHAHRSDTSQTCSSQKDLHPQAYSAAHQVRLRSHLSFQLYLFTLLLTPLSLVLFLF